MWKANIQRTERNGNTLGIIVSFTNGENSEDVTFTTDKPQNDTWLSEQIRDRLNQLNGLDEYEASINDDPIVSAKDIGINDILVIIDEKKPKIDLPIPQDPLVEEVK